MDLDFSGTSGLQPTALNFSSAASDGPASGLLGVDFSGGGSASDASELQHCRAALQSLSFPSPAAEEAHAAETPGERMRQALLSGKGNEFSKLFDQLQKPVVQASPADRFQALQGNLGNLFAPPAQAPSPFPMSSPFLQSSLPPLNDMPLMPLDASMPAQQPFATTPFVPPASASVSFSPASSTIPSFIGAPTSEPFPQLSGPQHVGDQMAQLQGLIATALQAQVETSGSKLPPSPNGNSRFSNSFGALQAVSTSPTTTTFEEEPKQENPFGDLLGAFNEKHPISGLGQDGLRILA